MKRLSSAVCLLLTALVVPLAAGDAAAETVVKLGSVAPEGTPWEEWIKKVEARMKKEAGGELAFKVYLAGKLGGEKEMIEDTKVGRLQMFGGSAGALATTYVPELDVLELPFLFESDAEADFVLDQIRPHVSKLLEQRGFVFAMWGENGWHGYGVKGRCVTKPDEMTGLKFRSQESRIHIDTFKSFGASPVELPTPEVLSSLQTGVVDGFSGTPIFAFAASWYQGIDHFTYTQHLYQPAMIVYSKKWFDKQPANIKKILMKTDEERAGIEGVRTLTKPLLENFGHAGVKLCHLTPEQRTAFATKARPVWDSFSKRSKGNKAIFDAVMKAKQAFAAKK